MNSRWLYITMIVWLTAWYGVIVPGHQRGMILVPGAEHQISAGGSCCETRIATRDAVDDTDKNVDSKPTDSRKKSNPERVKNCAVCAVAGLVDMPPPLVLTPVAIEDGITIHSRSDCLFALELPGHTVPFKRGPPAFLPLAA